MELVEINCEPGGDGQRSAAAIQRPALVVVLAMDAMVGALHAHDDAHLHQSRTEPVSDALHEKFAIVAPIPV